MKYSLKKIERALDLPEEWDSLAVCIFQKKAFYIHCEEYNPCAQRYYLLYSDAEELLAEACVFTITLDLLTFIQVKSPMKMHIVGIPATVSPVGIVGGESAVKVLLQRIYKKESGLLVGMNIDPSLDCQPAVSIKNMPTISFKHDFNNYNEYIAGLKSSYRRRMKRVRAKFKDVEVLQSDCSVFDESIYELYEQIYQRSKSKVEKLSLEFFKNLGPEYRLTRYKIEENLLAWHIIVRDGEVIYFFFGGTNYSLNDLYQSYFNNLAGLLEEALDMGCTELELGQTAEVPKTRLGGKVQALNLFLYHKNKIILFLLRSFKSLLQYNRKIPETHVIKTD